MTDAQRERLHGEINVALPLSWQLISVAMSLVVIMAIIFVAFADYSRIENAEGTITFDQGFADVRATRLGYVTTVSAQNGQEVKAGDPLLIVNVDELSQSAKAVNGQVMDALAKQSTMLERQAAAINGVTRAQIAGIAERRSGIAAEIERIDAQITFQMGLVEAAAGALVAAERLSTSGFISGRDLEERRATLLARQQYLSGLEQGRASKVAQGQELARLATQTVAQQQVQISTLRVSQSEVQQRAAAANTGGSYMLAAPIGGVITSMAVRPGQPVAPSDRLLSIIPLRGRPIAEIYVQSRAIAFVQKGLKVRMAVDAFPYQTFGMVDATISDVSENAVLKPGGKAGDQLVYLVKAIPEKPFVQAFGSEHRLLAGMELSARITTRRQSIFKWIFEPLYAIKRSS